MKNIASAQLSRFVGEGASPECNTEIYGLYSAIYQLKLKQLLGQEMTAVEIDQTRNVSMLCPDSYGEVVHWARGIRLSYEEAEYADIDCDGWESVESRERQSSEESSVSVIYVAPNPATEQITLSNPSIDNLYYSILNINGISIVKGQLGPEGSTSIDVSRWNNGLYLIEQYDDQGQLVDIKKISKI